MGLEGKIAWITGAGTGIGLAGAQALAEAGAVVVMSGRRGEVLEREAAQIRKGRCQSRDRAAGRERSRAGRRGWRPRSCGGTAESISW